MSERTIYIFAKDDVTITRDSNGQQVQDDVIARALNGDAFSWERPSDLSLTFSGSKVALTFDDSDGILSDDPFSGSTVIDQQLTQPVTINGVTYSPSAETTRWENPPPVNVENEYEVTLFDGAGNAYRMVGVSITEGYATSVVGVMFDGAQPPPGTTLHYIQGVSSYGGTGETVPISDGVICFLPGTQIDTAAGPCAIEDLHPGDPVLTLDHGPQPVRWIGRSMVCGLGHMAPIRIRAGALGNRRDLLVSPNHRVLLRAPEVDLCFGHREVLVPAKALIDGGAVQRVPMPSVAYMHLMLDAHELIFSEGIATETLFAGAMAQGVLGPQAMADLRAHCPDIEATMQKLTRPSISVREGRLLTGLPHSGVLTESISGQVPPSETRLRHRAA
ncbi:Hint domain-containing protein [Rhodobacteraceae bacterium KMM 6894]|nr:Hint domain-containing protein [Rhodobacteraceae bacterium KMM 6894]